MNPFLRQKPDGSIAPGYLAYVLAAGVAAAAVAVLHHRAAPGPRRARRSSISRVAPITEPAAGMTRVHVPNGPPPPEARSYRLASSISTRTSPSPPQAGEVGFDPIGTALRDAPAAEAERGPNGPLDEVSSEPPAVPSEYPQLPPAFPSENGPGGGAPAPSAAVQLLGYRDALADGPPRPSIAAPATSLGAEPAVPRGTLVAVYLLTSADSSNPSAVLQFAAARGLLWRGRWVVPFGTRFLGRLAGSPARERLNFSVDVVLYPDGRERAISASAVEADGNGGNLRPGVAAYYFPPPAWVQLAPYASDAFTGAMSLLELRARQSFSVGVGALTVQGPGTAESIQAPFYQAAAQAVQELTQARLKEAEQRYASYYLIPAGSAFWLQLEADFHE